jgi:hypothetical protein
MHTGNITNAVGKLKRLQKSKMPPKLICQCPLQVLMGRGCVCGIAQAEKALRAQQYRHKRIDRKDCAALNYLPAEGEVVVVRRPLGSIIDHGGVPLSVWHKCEGKQFEVLLSLWDDVREGSGLALLDLASILHDDFWFPLDGLELP